VSAPELLVGVAATKPLQDRIVAALEDDGLTIAVPPAPAGVDIQVVAIDLSRPTSVRALRERLTNHAGPMRVVAVSPACGPLGMRRAVRAGATAVVLEHELGTALVPAVRAVAAGLSAMPASLSEGADRLAFSHREREVLRLAVEGRTNGEIASTLFLAESTVKSHLSSAYRKLGAVGRKDAASMIFDPQEGLAEVVFGERRRVADPGGAATESELLMIATVPERRRRLRASLPVRPVRR
jgi:two-component system response regulator DesR